jgi:DNA-binding MarR family transcriptional regulator
MNLVSLDSVNIPLQLITVEINKICSDLQKSSDAAHAVAVQVKLGGQAINPENEDQILLKNAKILILERRRRQRYFSNASFVEPPWDILLDLFVAGLTGVNISVSSACIASGVPPSTALRHLSHLVTDKLVNRVADPNDARRIHLELSSAATEAMKKYLLAEVCDRG